MSDRGSSRFTLTVGGPLLLLLGCGPCSFNPVGPGDADEDQPGRVGVNTATTGIDTDPDGYTVELADRTGFVASNGQFSFADVPPGTYSLGLTEVAPNCAVVSVTPPTGSIILDQNPISISVTPGSNRFYNFAIECAENVAEIVAFNDTRGDPMTSAYAVTVSTPSTSETRDFPPDFNVYFDVPPGPVTVEVGNVPSHCILIGENPRTTAVEFGESETVAFDINCTDDAGALRVTTRTSGVSIDPDGYLVNVGDETIGFSNEAQFSYDFGPLATGDYQVFLFDVADNCTSDPASPVTASVLANQTVEQVFDIACTGVGSVSVDIGTTGEALDPDGYTLTVGGTSRAIPTNPTAPEVFEGLPSGQDVQVLLEGIAPNCTVAEANPQAVTVVTDAVTDAPGFTLACVSAGALQITTVTTGPAQPTGGFGVRIGSDTYPIGTNETLLFQDIPSGDVRVTLLEETETCTVADPNPRTITILMDQTVSTTFQISCPRPTPPLIFESDRDGDFDIYAMEEDGSGLIPLTVNGVLDIDPSWAWDNSKIIFVSDEGGQSDVWTMHPDGSNRTRITSDADVNEDPEFSPDGTKIVYEKEDPDDGTLEIFMADADGSNEVQLTDAAGISEAPHFHPDGAEILFKSDRDGDFDIYIMNADGSNVRQLTFTAVQDFDASWSPNGLQIVWSSQRAAPTREDIWIMNRDGSGQTRLLFNSVWDWHPVFSSDGSKIVYTSDRDGDYELFIMNADGTGSVQLTMNGARDTDAEFKKPIF